MTTVFEKLENPYFWPFCNISWGEKIYLEKLGSNSFWILKFINHHAKI